jgi:transcriptional regulator with XRE-family HTH domain
MSIYFVPPDLDLKPPTTIYVVEAQHAPMSFEMQNIVPFSDSEFNASLQQWLAEMRFLADDHSQRIEVIDLSAAARLHRIIGRTGWSQRDVGSAIGRSHTEVRRILERRRDPRDAVARIIADLDYASQILAQAAAGDQATIRRALTASPFDGADSALAAIRDGNLFRGMRLATRVLYPRVNGMLEVPDNDLDDGTIAYLDED